MKTIQIEGITSSQLQELFNDLGSKIEDLRNDIQDYCCPVNEKIKSRKKGNKSRWILPQSYYLCVAKQKRW